MLDELHSLTIQAEDKPRGVAIADFGNTDCVEIRDDLDSTEFKKFIDRGAAVVFWLPANSSAKIHVSTEATILEGKKIKPRVGKKGPKFYFSYEVYRCNCQAKPPEKEDGKARAAAGGRLWILFCNGQMHFIECDAGLTAQCTEAGPDCGAGAAG